MAELTTCMEKDADGAVPTSIIVPESCHRSSTALGQGYLVGERESVKEILAKERVSGNSSGLTTGRSGDKKTESPHHGNGLGALGLLLLLKESDLVASVVTELQGVGEQAA